MAHLAHEYKERERERERDRERYTHIQREKWYRDILQVERELGSGGENTDRKI